MYSVSIRNSENVAVPRISPPTFAPATVFVRRIPKRISGSACRRSPHPNTGKSPPPPAVAAIPPPPPPPPGRAEQPARRRDDADRSPRAPAIRAALGDRVDERHEPARDEHGAEGVERLDGCVAALVEETRGEDEGRHADRHVDEEDPRPAQRLRE